MLDGIRTSVCGQCTHPPPRFLTPRRTHEHEHTKTSCQAFVVNNYVGTDGLDEDAYCTLAPTPRLKQGLAAFCNVRACV